MEVAGLTFGAVALASLFSTVECFEYFTAAKSFEVDLQVLMVKLDIEKARLLTWGNDAGLLRSESEGRLADLADAEKASLVSRCLESITSLLSNASKLEGVYGLQKASGNGEAGADVVSANSMSVFRASYKRFWVRFAKDKQRASALSKTKWAVHDRSKFGKFIQDLKDLIDGLNEILPARREKRDQVIQDDISSILEISNLRLVESACDGTYMNWSAAASIVIEESQIGTVDRRNIEEWMMDTADFAGSRGSEAPTIRDQDSTVISDMPRLKLHDITGLWLLCAPQCPSGAESDQMKSCCSRDFGVRAFDPKRPMSLELDSESPFSLGQKMYDGVLFNPDYGAGREILPIYCSFCIPHIHTALGIIKRLQFHGGTAVLRLDDRLPSCCWSHRSGVEAVSAILEEMEVHINKNRSSLLHGYSWDRNWIEKRHYHIESRATQRRLYTERLLTEWDPYEAVNSIIADQEKNSGRSRASRGYTSYTRSKAQPFMVIGGTEFIHRLLDGFNLSSVARAPRERDLYEVTRPSKDENVWSSSYLGSYVPNHNIPNLRPPVSSGDSASQNRSSTSKNTSSRTRPLPPDFEKRRAKRTRDDDAGGTAAQQPSSQTIQISDE